MNLNFLTRKRKQIIEQQREIVHNILHPKSINQIIEEIHESFYTEVDRLLAEAKITNSLDTNKQSIIDKHNKLKALGFNNTKECHEAEKEIERLNILSVENKSKTRLIEAIDYFSFKYPNYKFITEESVKKICSKYSLVYGDVSKYTGNVPDENLKKIESFKIDEEDECCVELQVRYSSYTYSKTTSRFISFSEFSNKHLDPSSILYSGGHYLSADIQLTRHKCSLEIAAPLKDFNMSSSEVKDFKISDKIEIPDPVVLKPVFYNNNKYYLIVTAWGLESSDELVVNQKMN